MIKNVDDSVCSESEKNDKIGATNYLISAHDSNKKIKLLVCFIQAHIGGAMTSLVNFLNALDTDVYDIDVMFYENDGRHGIKENITILPQGKMHESYSLSNILKKIVSPSYIWAAMQDVYYKNIKHNIEIIVDRLVVKPGIEKRLTDSIENVLHLAEGLMMVDVIGGETIKIMPGGSWHINPMELTPEYDYNEREEDGY